MVCAQYWRAHPDWVPSRDYSRTTRKPASSRLKNQQAALRVHETTQSALNEVCSKFQENLVSLRDLVAREMSKLDVEAEVTVSLEWMRIHVTVPASSHTVTIAAMRALSFNVERLRSEFEMSPINHELGAVVPQTPMALPVTVKDGEVLRQRVSSIWWRGPSDNQRLATIAVMIFQSQDGPQEVRKRALERHCFVATAIFGENAEEVAILRKWRDDSLYGSLGISYEGCFLWFVAG
jgi:hypothetical protein